MLKVIVLVGLPGSGKSTLARQIAQRGWVRINQDEMGTRQVCEEAFAKAVLEGKNVVVDRCNVNKDQRKVWVNLAKRLGVHSIKAFVMDTDLETCVERAKVRQGHQNITAENAEKVIKSFAPNLTKPTVYEGFSEIRTILPGYPLAIEEEI